MMSLVLQRTLSLLWEEESRVRVERLCSPPSHKHFGFADNKLTSAPPPHPTLSPSQGRGCVSV